MHFAKNVKLVISLSGKDSSLPDRLMTNLLARPLGTKKQACVSLKFFIFVKKFFKYAFKTAIVFLESSPLPPPQQDRRFLRVVNTLNLQNDFNT